jgi:hypothetical protein
VIAATSLPPAAQGVLERTVTEARAGRFVEAWELAAHADGGLEQAQARTFVRYYGGDLEGALAEAALGLVGSPSDPLLLSTSAEIALSLHRGAAAQPLLARWRAAAAPSDASRLEQAARDLDELRTAEIGASRGVRLARWISALAGALALGVLLLWARRAE